MSLFSRPMSAENTDFLTMTQIGMFTFQALSMQVHAFQICSAVDPVAAAFADGVVKGVFFIALVHFLFPPVRQTS